MNIIFLSAGEKTEKGCSFSCAFSFLELEVLINGSI